LKEGKRVREAFGIERGSLGGKFELLFLFVMGLLKDFGSSMTGSRPEKGGKTGERKSCIGLHKLDRLTAGESSPPS
jgi:hypothetical protein